MPATDTDRLGILLARDPDSRDARWACALARAAAVHRGGVDLFLMDRGADLLNSPLSAELAARGVRISVCTRSATDRELPLDLDHVDYSSQFQLGRIVFEAARFVSFA